MRAAPNNRVSQRRDSDTLAPTPKAISRSEVEANNSYPELPITSQKD
jgi:hypothetical protein